MYNIEEFKSFFNEIIDDVKPDNLVKKRLKFDGKKLSIDDFSLILSKEKKIHLLGSGKAVVSMAKAIYELMEKKIESAVLVGPYENKLEYENITYIKSTHPLPTQKSLDAANELIKKLSSLEEDDFFIYLLSGGNSALVELPVDEITLDEFQQTTDLMLKGAMPIEAINCVRKHISQVKGGRLAKFTKAKGIVITLSDVLGDDLEAIGSAPLYKDSTTFEDAINYLNTYNLFEKLPLAVKNYLENGLDELYMDTPKYPNKNIKHYFVGSNDILMNSAKNILEKKELNPTIIDYKIDDNVDEIVKGFVDFVKTEDEGCFIFGGEATVKVSGNGRGGRNQHTVLAFLKHLPKDKKVIFLSGASDGVDGNSNAAGAIIDSHSLEKAKSLSLDVDSYLNNFDSYHFFQKMNQLLIPGPTHNNMLDIVIIYIKKEK